MVLTITVPWAALCSDNRKYVSGKFVLTQQYRSAREHLALLARQAAAKQRWPRAEGPLRLEVVVTEPDHRKRDLNWSKATKDAITHGERVWWDDSQVRDERWRFALVVDKAAAGAVLTISPLGAQS